MTHVNNKQLELPIASPSYRATASEVEKLSESNVRAITLWQPWASLVALLLKLYETRSWSTSYRGKLLIHAAKRNYAQDCLKLAKLHPDLDEAIATALSLPLGAVVAIADLTACQKMWSTSQLPSSPIWIDDVRANETEILIEDQTELERAVGDWAPGRYAWKLENIIALPEPVPCKGAQQLWNPPADVIEKVLKQL